jgi:hypothetical protein
MLADVAARARSLGAVPLELQALARLNALEHAARQGAARREGAALRQRMIQLGYRTMAGKVRE